LVRRKGLPELGELVLCKVERVTPFAGWCSLEEYPEAKGMIHISEAAGKWIYDIREVVKLGKQYVAKVVKIDKEKNFVNLSLKRVSAKEEKDKLNSFRKEQRAEKVLEQAAKELNKTLDQAYEEVGFLLQDKFGELSVALEEARKSKDVLLKILPKEWADVLFETIQKAFKEKEIKLKAEVELKCYAKDGIEKIKAALENIEKSGLTVKYISAPKYRVEAKTTNPKIMEKKMKEILEKTVKEFEGEANFRMIK
jgi:translation initiation factor 2 subunit 1